MTKAKGKIAWPVTCADCGVGKIRPATRAGRTSRYKTLVLEVPADLSIPTCDNCGAEWIDPGTAAALDDALESAFEVAAHAQVEALLNELASEVTQRRMEAVLGLSQGYLSKLRSGTSTPSAMLLACLKLLARDPANRIQELESVGRARRPSKVAAKRGTRKEATGGRR
jgi:DNA-binding transcriptional regulator YiaG